MTDNSFTLEDSIAEFVGDDPERQARFDEAGRSIETGHAITTLREKLRMNEKQFAEILGLSEKELLKLEYGDFAEPSDAVMGRIRARITDWLGFMKESQHTDDADGLQRNSA